jgi:hypothetical protein
VYIPVLDIEEIQMEDDSVKIGDIQVDSDKSEWVVIGVNHSGISRVRKNSLAHKIHAEVSPDIAKSLKEVS